MYEVLRPHVRKLLADAGETVTFVDVGSRNGVLELGSIAEFVSAYGFEPNPDEYAKLLSGDTDAARLGVVPPTFRRLEYFPYALGADDGRAKLYVTRGPGATGLLEPNVERLREIRWKGRTFDPDFATEIFAIERTVEVETRSLGSVAAEHGIEHADYLKIDVEGVEYEVLEGAGDLLDRVGVIRVEVCFIPFRKGQRLFSDVDLLLRARGFDLLGYEVVPEQVGYKERTSAAVFGPAIGYPDRYGQPLSGDAVYVNRELTDPKRALVQAAILIDKNYLDEALFVLRRKTAVEDAELLELLRDFKLVLPRHRAAVAFLRAKEHLVQLRRLAARIY